MAFDLCSAATHCLRRLFVVAIFVWFSHFECSIFLYICIFPFPVVHVPLKISRRVGLCVWVAQRHESNGMRVLQHWATSRSVWSSDLLQRKNERSPSCCSQNVFNWICVFLYKLHCWLLGVFLCALILSAQFFFPSAFFPFLLSMFH